MKKILLPLLPILLIVSCEKFALVDHTHSATPDVYGCTDIIATNFDSTATIFDNSCKYPFVFTNPIGGENLSVGDTFEITWIGGNINDTIRLSLIDVETWTTENNIVQTYPNTGSYNWSVQVDEFGCGEKQIYIGDIPSSQWEYSPIFNIIDCNN